MRLTRPIALVSILLLFAPSFLAIDTLPRALSDEAFWRMVSDFSEESGNFRFQYMSNEREFQFVIPRLKEMTKPGGVYLGVGPEQNFTYIAAIQPKIAFIFDIRRANMLEHLMYKAIFEISSNRAEFVSRLFSRRPDPGLNGQSTVTTLFQAFRRSEADPQLFQQNLQAIKERLTKNHRFKLTADDLAAIDDVYETLFRVGPGMSYPGGAFGPFGGFGGGSYAGLMTATDENGQARSYLATEENFRFVREMERKNLIVPLVGDFAGPKALRTVAKYLKDRKAPVTAFYTSNVEQYLFQQGDDWRHFLANVGTFPLDRSSTFIRSSHFSYDGGGAQFPSRQVGGGNFLSLLCPMQDLVASFNAGRIQSYEHVIRMSR